MEKENGTEHCDKCRTVVYAFSKKIATSDESSYCIKCAEELDSQYLKRNICSVCTTLLDRQEIKFVMPSRLYSSYFFDRLPMENRLMCSSCYVRANRLNLVRNPLIKIGTIKAKLRSRLTRSITRRAILKDVG